MASGVAPTGSVPGIPVKRTDAPLRLNFSGEAEAFAPLLGGVSAVLYRKSSRQDLFERVFSPVSCCSQHLREMWERRARRCAVN